MEQFVTSPAYTTSITEFLKAATAMTNIVFRRCIICLILNAVIECQDFFLYDGRLARSTLRQNRPNKSGLKRTYVHCTYVRTSVCSRTISSISVTFGTVGRGRWVMHGCTVCSMTRSKVKVKVTSPSKLEIRLFSTAIFSAIYNGSWQLTTDA